MVITVTREIQFPEEQPKIVNIDEIVDDHYQHLYEKRRNKCLFKFFNSDEQVQKVTFSCCYQLKTMIRKSYQIHSKAPELLVF